MYSANGSNLKFNFIWNRLEIHRSMEKRFVAFAIWWQHTIWTRDIQSPRLEPVSPFCICRCWALSWTQFHNCTHTCKRLTIIYKISAFSTIIRDPSRVRLIARNQPIANVISMFLSPADITTTTISSDVAYAISGSRLYSFSPEPTKNKSPLSSENTRHLLSCFVWILKNLNRNVLYRWTLSQTPHRVHQMLQVLNVCIPSFEYKGQKRQPVKRNNTQSFRKTADMKERLEECIRGTGSARNDLINRRKDRNISEKLRWRKDQMPYRWVNHFFHFSVSNCKTRLTISIFFICRSQFYDSVSKSEVETELNSHIEGSLATEVCLVVLDTLEMIVQVASASELHHSLLGVVLKVLLHALARNQSTLALQNLFATQRSLIFKYHNLLFDEESDSCADLCLLLLKHCGSQLPSIRSQAAASLYLLMRQNFEIGNVI